MPTNSALTQQSLYTVNHKQTCHFVFDYNYGYSWSIFIPVETERNTLQLS